MAARCYLVRDEHVPARAAFPVVDAHNHLWGDRDVDRLVAVMDEVGVASCCDLTADVSVEWGDGGYRLGPGRIEDFFADCAGRHPGRVYGFTTAGLAAPTDRPLFDDAERFAAKTAERLGAHVAMGARGLKVLKELGLHYRDAAGELIAVNDRRLGPIWDAAASLGVPVLMHQSDPVGFFEPVTPDNEHYESLRKYPSWSFADRKFPRKAELLARRDDLVARHPATTFILPHVANFAEDLGYVSRLLVANANVHVDISARLDELGRQPYRARAFFLRWQDRVLFGTDMPASAEMYRCHFRFLETFDEHFFPPDYDGTFDRRRWAICGIGLPGDVLAKVYYRNAVRLIPGLREDLAGRLRDNDC